MTAPAAAKTGKYGSRVYPVAHGEGDEIELVELPSVSNVLKVLDAPALNTWKMNVLAETLSMRPDLIMLAANPGTRRDAIRQALDSDKTKANAGTGLHYFTEAVDNDTLDWSMIPEVAKPYVEHYAAAKEEYGWRMVEQEVTIYNHTARYAGTTDRVMEFRDEGICIADVKTGSAVYADQALQLAMYGNGEGIWEAPDPALVDAAVKALVEELDEDQRLGLKRAEDGKKISAAYIKRREAVIDEERWKHYARLGVRRPMPEGIRKDLGFILHLTAEGFELIPMNLQGAYEAVQGICAAYHWKTRRDIIGKPVEPRPLVRADRVAEPEDLASELGMPDPMEPTPTPVVAVPPSDDVLYANLRERLMALPDAAKEKVAFSWPNGTPGLKALAHTRTQLDDINQLIFDIECSIAPAAEHKAAEAKAVQMVREAFPESAITEDF